MFHGKDSEPDWINLDKVAIPQADEQQRLLVNLIYFMNDRKPLPRFWYLPHGKKAAVIMAGDNHCSSPEVSAKTEKVFVTHIEKSPPNGSVDDWECVRSTSYVYDGVAIDDPLKYVSKGFELGVHVNSGCTDPWTASNAWMDSMPIRSPAVQSEVPKLTATTDASLTLHCQQRMGYPATY